MRRILLFSFVWLLFGVSYAQINTDRVLTIGRNALFFEDYVLSIQYFNQVIQIKPYLYEPYFYRAVAKVMLEDFKGAEADCTLALERNPFVVNTYHCRGYARLRLGDYKGAIEDYEKGIEYAPEDKSLWINKGIAHAQNEEFDKAEQDFSHLISLFPNFSQGYLNRSAMYLEKKDTINALLDIEKALILDKYSSHAYALRGLVSARRAEYEKALVDFNEALHLDPKRTDYYINRGMVRYYLNDLRGAMSDYDMALEFQPGNVIARFNRGLLRAHVGDDNRAIEDFDYVIEAEPDNFMAIYNRALIRMGIGDADGAIADFTAVLNEYPDFYLGYYARAQAKRKGLDKKGAELDDMTGFALETNRGNIPGIEIKKDTVETEEDKIRRESDRNIRKFNRLVVADDDEIGKNNYTDRYRGKIQYRNVAVIELQPLYYVSFYQQEDNIRRDNYYDGQIGRINRDNRLANFLFLTSSSVTLNNNQITNRFASINQYAAKIDSDSTDIYSYLGRSIDFMLTQDVKSALEDCNKVISLDKTCVPAYLNRAYLRHKELEYDHAVKEQEEPEPLLNPQMFVGATPQGVRKIQADKREQTAQENIRVNMERKLIIDDYSRILELDPEFVIAYYNRANIYSEQKEYKSAIADYTKAIQLEPDFASAYYNRGLTYILSGKADRGIEDLSKAGELGIIEAYNLIKRYSD